MIEILVLPGWNIPETPLTDWAEQFAGQGLGATVTRESTGVSWIEVNALRLRGYAVMNGRTVEAINFELAAIDPAPARAAIEGAASALGWELHEDDETEEAGDDDD